MCPLGVLDVVFDPVSSHIEVTNPHLLPQAWNSFVLFDSHTNRVLISGMAAAELDPTAATTNFEVVRERLSPEQALCLVDSASGLVHKIATKHLEWPFRQVHHAADDFSAIAAGATSILLSSPIQTVSAPAATVSPPPPPLFLTTPLSVEQERIGALALAVPPVSEAEPQPASSTSSAPAPSAPAPIPTSDALDVAAEPSLELAAPETHAAATTITPTPTPKLPVPMPSSFKVPGTSDIDLLSQLDVLSVADWLKRIGLEALITEFVKLEIDGRALALLSVNALRKSLSVTTRDAIILDGERLRLIKNLRDGGSVS